VTFDHKGIRWWGQPGHLGFAARDEGGGGNLTGSSERGSWMRV
jgi:hypothetical protein